MRPALLLLAIAAACGAPASRPDPAPVHVRPALGATPAALAASTGTIEGVVSDPARATPISGVVVLASSPALTTARSATSDGTGSYRLADLPAGEYVLTFHHDGRSLERRVRVRAGEPAPVHVELAPAGVDACGVLGAICARSQRR